MYNPKDDEQIKDLKPEMSGVKVPEQSAQPDQYQQSINRMALNNAGAELAMQRNINQQAQELQRAEQEQRDASRLEAQKPIWGAATEFAGALFNLWGTTNGANNQQQHIYSQDWMTRADANRRERKQRIDNIRERQRAAELQLAQLKAGNANALEQMRMDNQLRQENRAIQQQQMAMQQRQMEMQAQNQTFNQQATAAELAMREKANNNNLAMDRQKLDADMAARGFKPNAKGGYDYDPELAGQIAQSEYRSKYGTAGRGSTGNGSNMTFTLAANGNMPEETITMNEQSLKNTLLANAGAIDDLDEKDAKSLELMLKSRDYDENDLKPYLQKSAKLRGLVKKAAYTVGANNIQEEPDNRVTIYQQTTPVSKVQDRGFAAFDDSIK